MGDAVAIVRVEGAHYAVELAIADLRSAGIDVQRGRYASVMSIPMQPGGPGVEFAVEAAVLDRVRTILAEHGLAARVESS